MPDAVPQRALPDRSAPFDPRAVLALTTMTDVRDGHDHLITDEELARPFRADGTRRALCGAMIVPAPLVYPPGGRCVPCAALVAPPPPVRPWSARWAHVRRTLMPPS